MRIKSTKAWHKLPCAHAQWHDRDNNGAPGECASWHGYDRTVKMTFCGDIDEMGWIVPFGGLRQVKKFIEYYFDHTAVIPANDPRKDALLEMNETFDPPIFKARVLPYGVSMEMSSLFIWEQVNPYIYDLTLGRCYVERVDCIEHDSNSAFIEVDQKTAFAQAVDSEELLVCKPVWDAVPPKQVINKYKFG